MLPNQNKNKLNSRSKKYKIFWSIAGTMLFIFAIFILLASQPPQPKMTAEKVGGKIVIDSTIKIEFNLPIAREAEVDITPKVYGTVSYDDYYFEDHLAKAIVFTPELTWRPDTTYEIRISNVKSALPLLNKAKEYSIVFTAEAPPEIVSVLPGTKDVIRPDLEWQMLTDKAADRLSKFKFIFEPSISVSAKLSEDKKLFALKPDDLLSQGQEYKLKIYKNHIRYKFGTDEVAYQGEPEVVWQGDWQVREAPGITSFSPQGTHIPLDESIEFVFSENIDFDSFKEHASIEPKLSGKWFTEDFRTVKYNTDDLQQDTPYVVAIEAGLKTFGGGYFEEKSSHNFSTIGPVKISHSFPSNGNQGIGVNSDITITFDQDTEQASVVDKFKIEPAVEGEFTWSDNKILTFSPAVELQFNQIYKITLSTGMKSAYGIATASSIVFSFTTEQSVTKLSVPFHRQEHNLSCEIATLVMALKYRGLSVSEAVIIEAIGVDPAEKQNGVWGNPHIAFVGDIDGRQPSTGYGVYWQPIAQVAQSYREAEWFTGWSITDITNEIKQGNPVIIWGTAGSGSRIDWKTPQGGNVVAINGEHTFIVTGFIGSADNPSSIIVLDPLYGERYFTQSRFLWNWGLLNNSGVVVR